MKSLPPARPIVATIGIVFNEGRVLLIKRANPPDAGLWGLPGGKIDFGETILKAAEREVLEETGVHVRAQCVYTAVDAFDLREEKIHQHFVLLAVLCQWIAGEPVAGDDALEALWLPLCELKHTKLAMSLNVREVIEQGRITEALLSQKTQ